MSKKENTFKKDENGEPIQCKYCGVTLWDYEDNICIWCVEKLELGKEWCEEEQRWI